MPMVRKMKTKYKLLIAGGVGVVMGTLGYKKMKMEEIILNRDEDGLGCSKFSKKEFKKRYLDSPTETQLCTEDYYELTYPHLRADASFHEGIYTLSKIINGKDMVKYGVVEVDDIYPDNHKVLVCKKDGVLRLLHPTKMSLSKDIVIDFNYEEEENKEDLTLKAVLMNVETKDSYSLCIGSSGICEFETLN